MKAAVYYENGGPGVLKYEDAPDPELHPRGIVIRVEAVSIEGGDTLNRQGGDVGTQYRSVIFYHSPEQKQIADDVIRELNASGRYDSEIVTEVAELPAYYPAESYHQDYFARNPAGGYCQAVVAPKVAKARKQFFDKYAARS